MGKGLGGQEEEVMVEEGWRKLEERVVSVKEATGKVKEEVM